MSTITKDQSGEGNFKKWDMISGNVWKIASFLAKS